MGELIGSLQPEQESEIMEHPVEIENVFKPGHGHGGGGEGGLASALPLLLAGRADGGWGHGAGGFGAGLVGGVLGGALFGGRRGGLFGGDSDNGGENRLQDNADTLAILGAIGSAKDATTSGFGTTALALSQGFANLKDSQQAGTFLLSNQLNTINQNVSDQGCKTRETVLAAQGAIISKIDANTIAELTAELAESRHHGRSVEGNVTVSQTVNQAQAQQQQQQQFQTQNDLLRQLFCEVAHTKQIAQATNQNIIAGNAGAVTTGAQTANPTNVNTR
jgi:hypothetical protein